MPVGRSIAPQELAQFASEIQGVTEKRRWALYDRVTFAASSNVVGDISFFSLPIGQGTPAKTLLDTNMSLAGQLPARQGFEVWDIRVYPQLRQVKAGATTSIAALAQLFWDLIYGGSLVFRQAQKVDLEIAPIAMLPAGYGSDGLGFSGTEAGAVMLNNGQASKAALWDLDPLPIIILPQRSFGVTINYPTAVALPADVTLSYWVHLDGILHRAA